MTVHVLLAGGGTAGHVEPALAVADALRRRDSAIGITLLGTATGMEARLVPARGYELAEIARVPLPRRLTPDLLRLPGRLLTAVRQAGRHLDRVGADVVIGFGGYVALPAYLAARRRGIPVVVHEGNVRAGIANRVGARLARHVAVAVAGTGLPGEQVVGLPLRPAIAGLDRVAMRAPARTALGLHQDGPVLLVFGGSQGADRLNGAVIAGALDLAAAGVQVLHITGAGSIQGVRSAIGPVATHHAVAYLDRMELAYAAADLVLCRAGALTCAELTTVGLPAVYVPLPIGNGEQSLNAAPTVRAGGGLLVADADLDAAYLRQSVLPLLADPARLQAMAVAARRPGAQDAADALAGLILQAARPRTARGPA